MCKTSQASIAQQPADRMGVSTVVLVTTRGGSASFSLDLGAGDEVQFRIPVRGSMEILLSRPPQGT